MQIKQENVTEISNTEQKLKLEAWKKYQVTDENRQVYKELQEVDHIITVLTKNDKHVLACFVTRKENQNG